MFDTDRAKVEAVAAVYLDLVRAGFGVEAAEERAERAARKLADATQIMRGIALARSLRLVEKPR